MSAFFSSIKNMVDNYGQGFVSIQGKLSIEIIIKYLFAPRKIIKAVGLLAAKKKMKN